MAYGKMMKSYMKKKKYNEAQYKKMKVEYKKRKTKLVTDYRRKVRQSKIKR